MTASRKASMVKSPIPIRTLLFVPGSRGEWFRKAPDSGVDAIALDLEASVARSELARARGAVRDFLDEFSGQRPMLFVRVSNVRSDDVGPDLEAVVCEGLDALMLPRIMSATDVHAIDARVAQIERRRGLPIGSVPFCVLLETAAAIRTAYEVAISSPRIVYVAAGASPRGDVARSLGYRWTPEGLETLYIRSRVILDVRAAGIQYPIGGIWVDVEDLDGLRRYANQTRDLGYTGMMVIHPSHVPVVNEVFSPTSEEIATWRQVIEAMENAEREGLGAIRMGGQLVDIAHAETCKEKLAFAEKLGIA